MRDCADYDGTGTEAVIFVEGEHHDFDPCWSNYITSISLCQVFVQEIKKLITPSCTLNIIGSP